jgi:hypothetical protein
MISKFGLAASIAVAALLLVSATTCIAQAKVTITGFYVDVIDIYADEAGETKQREVNAADVKLPVDVIKTSPNYMMLVNIGGKQGWIYATVAETEGAIFKDIDIGSCNQAVPEESASLRGVGTQCGN